jgi:hypothetical protein
MAASRVFATVHLSICESLSVFSLKISELDAKSVMNAMSLSHERFDPLFDQVRKELEYEESRSQQDPNADPATLTAKQDAWTEVIDHTARYFNIYHPK